MVALRRPASSVFAAGLVLVGCGGRSIREDASANDPGTDGSGGATIDRTAPRPGPTGRAGTAEPPLPWPSCTREDISAEIAERCGENCPVASLARLTCPEAYNVIEAVSDDGLIHGVSYDEDVSPDGRLDFVGPNGAERTTGAVLGSVPGWLAGELVLFRKCVCARTYAGPKDELVIDRRHGDVWNREMYEPSYRSVHAREYTDTLYVIGEDKMDGIYGLFQRTGVGADARETEVMHREENEVFHVELLFDERTEPVVVYEVGQFDADWYPTYLLRRGDSRRLPFDAPEMFSALWRTDLDAPLVAWMDGPHLKVHGFDGPDALPADFGEIEVGAAGACPEATIATVGTCPDSIEGTTGVRRHGSELVRGRDGRDYLVAIEVAERVRCDWLDVTPGGCTADGPCECNLAWGASRATGGRMHIVSLPDGERTTLELGPLLTEWETRPIAPALFLWARHPPDGAGYAVVTYKTESNEIVKLTFDLDAP
jgi:hypothetical protein